ncbi:hypothetical protein [Hymenobacter volaticus]|uniref:Histidine kinase n=1 Tax=Hymenobacter volaticus TaxID=2932254 RepID=A0ABY4GGH8_9BACT|nr:hypothetical protein [Hymenobacter volaticus]UOQ69399.1 hypothetical protein MUN86_27305 [Hymenobacter volaticus]
MKSALSLLLFTLTLSLLLAGNPTRLLAGGPVRYRVAGQEKAVALLMAGKATYLVTEQTVWRRRGRQFVPVYRSTAPIHCALLTDTTLWLGTQQGLLQVSTHSGQARPLTPAGPSVAAPITALLQDATGAVWVGVAGYGVYQQVQGAWQAQLRIPTLNAGLATVDSAVWIATNIGLYQWHKQQWTRYNEEGVANHEIPDNIVEKLLPDGSGNMWVLMSEGISLFAKPSAAGDAPLSTVKYLGRPGNEVYSVAYLPGQGYLFATTLGLLLLPAELPSPGHSSAPAAPDQVQSWSALVPVALPGSTTAPDLLHVDARHRVWVLQPGQVSVWRRKGFPAAAQPAGVTRR